MVRPTTIVEAAPAGRRSDGSPIPAQRFEVDDRREAFGISSDGRQRTRLFQRTPWLDARPGQGTFAPVVVYTDSITEQPPALPSSGESTR